ncbi:hypothetical protein [Desulfosporosinus sp. BG]|uniref:hypothetical protein n=1 Tax=Desulfosporosinus sp. BG TaxID=1633135 RepID=UPI000856BC91|nr:hypothetical protein [Desulfosporosinus sp. BG]ODA40461.1 hypothetical protein DSBG_2778 [Desulfosporosinus sp. BG]
MNWVIDRKEIYLEELSRDMYHGLEPIAEEYTMEELYARLENLQEKMKGLGKQSIKAGNVDENGHSVLSAEIEKVQNRMKKLKEQQIERTMREKRVEELRDYLIAQESRIDKFDDVQFRNKYSLIKLNIEWSFSNRNTVKFNCIPIKKCLTWC